MVKGCGVNKDVGLSPPLLFHSWTCAGGYWPHSSCTSVNGKAIAAAGSHGSVSITSHLLCSPFFFLLLPYAGCSSAALPLTTQFVVRSWCDKSNFVSAQAMIVGEKEKKFLANLDWSDFLFLFIFLTMLNK